MRFLYTFSISIYTLSIHLAALFLPKAAAWVKGRKHIFDQLAQLKKEKPGDYTWFHCASLGEFEQGRPLIEALRKKDPQARILLTFFSPSGFEVRKNYSEVDGVLYLPADFPSNASRFVKLLQPKAAFFIKYEFWFNYLNVLKKQKVPVYLISGIFREKQHFFRFYGSWFASQLKAFRFFFLQNQSSFSLLQSLGYSNCLVTGDTRFDRVSAIAAAVPEIPVITKFADNQPLFIAGSTWKEDEELLAISSLIEKGYKLVIAPHEIGSSHLQELIKRFEKWQPVRFSAASQVELKKSHVLIIDNIGMLSAIYRYATISYVGGGFGRGIHNLLEAAAHQVPVIFGPNHQKFAEASALILCGGGFEVQDKAGFEIVVTKLQDGTFRQHAALAAGNYVKQNSGATAVILAQIL